MSSSPQVQERVLTLVTNILSANSIVVDVLPGSRLADIGMTSMDMVNLMLAVEAEFDLTIPQAEITPENFQSAETIERMVTKQIEPNVAA
jgi:acyl carrier protein